MLLRVVPSTVRPFSLRPSSLSSVYHPPLTVRKLHRTIRNMASLKRKAPGALDNDSKKPKKDASLTSFFGPPKIVSSSTTKGASSNVDGSDSVANGAPVKFDKEKWVATLSEEQKKLLKLEIDTLHPSWLAHLKEEVTHPEFLNLKRFLQKEMDSGKKVFPPPEEIYSWSRHTPLNIVKAVILGQDPYHNNNQAHGLCFSVRPPTPAPPSLKNMYTALKKDYPSFTPPPNNGGLLTPWAEQGILMLNTCLTVRAHEANSHSKQGWERFTQKVIDTVAKVRTRGVVFLAWGKPAEMRCAKINGSKHLVLKSVHPSPLSAARGFFDCGHFKKTNDWLETRYGKGEVINWDLNKPKPIKGPQDGVSEGSSSEPVKVTEDQKKVSETKQPEPVVTTPAKVEVKTVKQQDEFEEDEDALEAMEELAKEGVVGDTK